MDRSKEAVKMAVEAASRGWTVVKIIPGTKKAAEKWRGLDYRDPRAVAQAWGNGRYAVGILTEPSRLVYDDLDVDHEGNPVGEWSLEGLVEGDWSRLPPTFELRSPSGGRGLLWSNPNGRGYKTCAGQVADHFDVRGHGGLFVLYDPTQPGRYVLDGRDPAPIPQWLSDLHPEPGSSSGRMARIPSVPAWQRKYGGGDMCPEMERTLDKALSRFEGDLVHDAMIAGVYALVGDCVAGHTGLNLALETLHTAFVGAYQGKARASEAGEEWSNAVKNAIAKKVGAREGVVAKNDPCAAIELDDDPENMVSTVAVGGTYVDDIDDSNPEWLCKPFLPFGSLVIIDGDPGDGKSMITGAIAARASRGVEILPDTRQSFMEPIRVGLVIAEDDESIVRGRLRAAGYKFDRSIMFMKTKVRNGGYLKFPDHIKVVRGFIKANNLRLLIVDPISQYIGEKTQTHNDASVRDALGPLGEVAKETGCCILLVRHLNKAGNMKAMYRGGGSIAFSALARSGLITGELEHGKRGLAQVKCSYARKFEGALSYIVTEWEEDEEIPVVEWQGKVDIDVDTLVAGKRSRRGPDPFSQHAIQEVLEELFATKDTWPAKEVEDALKNAGVSTDPKTINKVKHDMGIVSRPVKSKTGGFAQWEWTTKPPQKSKVGKPFGNNSKYDKDDDE